MAGRSRKIGSRSIAGERRRVQRPRALEQHERSRERLLDGHLLVDREPDQQRERLAHQQLVRLVGVGEVQLLWHASDVNPRGSSAHSRRRRPEARATGRDTAARIASSVPTRIRRSRARVIAV